MGIRFERDTMGDAFRYFTKHGTWHYAKQTADDCLCDCHQRDF